MKTPLPPPNDGLSATAHAILTADQMYMRDELEDRLWERRGLLKRLVRSDQIR